jgi:acyl transferase domain-containing protein/SAM-dependent methyltransferase
LSQHESTGSELSPVKRALLEIRETRAKLEALQRQRSEPLAIIGMGCRFPGGVRNAESYWELLRNGVDAITEIPADRWDANAYYDPAVDAPGKMATRWGGFVEGIDQFDPAFFNISPREAMTMDPQQRLLLEVAWEALERACQAPDRLNESATGVFVGLSTNDYAQIQLQHGAAADIDTYFGTGGAHSVVAGRLSYILGLRGPSMAVDTACSSSLVAIHLACQSLRARECRMALAGGVNTILLPELTMALSKARMMASDGRCKTFDAAADGFVRSEGCGVIVLKRLSDARADGDTVLAVIRGSAVNQDGRSSGLTAPNGPSQTAVIRAALANAGLEPREIHYVEAHGTGTSLGDPIEAQALAAALGEGRGAGEPFLLGSVKTNLGHMEAAAGVGGLIKVVLSLQRGEIPAHLHLRELSPHIPWPEIPAVVPTKATAWPAGAAPKRAGISSFGFGGTNAHVVVEEAPSQEFAPRPARPAEVLTLSAKTPAALRTLAGVYAEALAQPGNEFSDVCYSANIGRASFEHRLALVAASGPEAREILASFAATGVANAAHRMVSGVAPPSVEPGVVFLFTGLGSQHAGMGRALYDSEPVFRRTIEECTELLRPLLDRSLTEVMFDDQSEGGPLTQTMYAQPALFAIEYALAQLWLSWGVTPVAVMGHSLGEDVAACVAGVFSLEDGLRLVAERGRLMQALEGDGGMLTVFADEATVRAALSAEAPAVSIAARNAPTNIVISGKREALARIAAKLAAGGVKTRDLAVSNGCHSALMDPMLEAFERAAARVRYSEPRIPLVSNVSGEFARPEEVTNAAYWVRHVREAVQFEAGLEALTQRGHSVFLEIGPEPTLVALGVRCQPDSKVWLPSIRKGGNDTVEMLNSLAVLYANGVAVNWAGVYRDQQRRKVALPTYPFERERYWHDALATAAPTANSAARWSRVLEAAERGSNVGPLDLRLDTYAARWAALDRVTVEHMLAALSSLQAFTGGDDALTVDELIGRCGILPTYQHLMQRWLTRLEAAELVARRADGRYVSRDGLRAPQIEEAWQAATRLNADLPALLDYLDRCGRLLVAVLTGSESPLETIFPGGDFRTAEFLYEKWALVRYFNGVAAAVAETVAATSPQGRPLRVMELGAGTGGMTSALLPALAREGLTYCFTDMSEAFLARAARKFEAYPCVRYGLFDIEQPPAAQGYSAGGFDLVVAANCVHATRDLRASLANIRSLLAPGGVLLLYEVTEHLPWFEMSVGLIEGWERFADDIRGEDPLLKPAQWTRLLTEAGFSAAESLPRPGAAAEVLGHHILIARMPGEVGSDASGASNESRDQPAIAGAANVPAFPQPAQAPPLLEELAAAGDEERIDLLVDFVRQHVAQVLRLAKGRAVERRQRLMDLGIDSLMAVELRNSLGQGLRLARPLPATLMFDHPTIEAVAKFLAREWAVANSSDKPQETAKSKEPASAADSEAGDGQQARARQVADLSDEEVELMLLRKLGSR